MFQFTHPGRGATSGRQDLRNINRCFNSRTPGGVRRLLDVGLTSLYSVSIHAPREGCDSVHKLLLPFPLLFQFTHPGRGATFLLLLFFAQTKVSIHAPREGCDW